MIHVATTNWFDLVMALMEAHDIAFVHADMNSRAILEEYYGARYRFVSPFGRFVYVIEFKEPYQETVFRLKYSDYL